MYSLCPHCGNAVARRRRLLLERLFVRRVLECASCAWSHRVYRVPFERAMQFAASRYTQCIQCGSPRVKRLPARDVIDPTSRHPFSLLLHLTGAPIYHCNLCRLQYHDWREPPPGERRVA